MKKVVLIALYATVIMGFSLLSAQTPAKKKKPETTGKIADGFHSTQWGETLSNVKNAVTGKITYTDEKRSIISRDGDIEYQYGFLYIEKPSETKGTGEAPLTVESQSRLFYVSIRFPYLAKDDVQKKIQEKFGNPTGESIREDQGAVIWDSEKTTIIMWVDRYEKSPFVRKITYFSKEISRELKNYEKEIFNRKEMEILKKLKP